MTFEVEPSDLIGKLRILIEDKLRVSRQGLQLSYRRSGMEDCYTFDHYGIKDNTTIYLVLSGLATPIH